MKRRVRQVYDEWLILSYQSGNRKALSLLVKRWHSKLLRHIYYKTDHWEASKDLVQDSWVAILHGLDKLRDPADFGVWAMRIANNKAVDWIRKTAREREFLDKESPIFPEMVGKEGKNEEIERIRLSYRKLDHRHRILINLHYRQGYSIHQMARILRISEGTVKSRLFTARNELKNRLNRNL